MAESEIGITQNLRDFTVQIIHTSDPDYIVGTGIAVSLDGGIVTCAHVVRQAGVDPHVVNGVELGVYFPQAAGGEQKQQQAVVAAYFPEHDDDVVLLRLTGGKTPLAPERIPVIGQAECSQDHPFRSYGYRPLPPYLGGWADGTIMGCVERPRGRNLQVEPVQLKSQNIAPGMSGSGVLDTRLNLLVGIVSETYFPRSDDPKDRDLAWAVDTRVLSLAPLGMRVQQTPLPLKPARQSPFDQVQARLAVAPVTPYAWNNAPPPLPEWTGRDELLRELDAGWVDPAVHLAGLIGFGGEGKSSLARQWVQSVIEGGVAPGAHVAPPAPDGVFWWGFYENRSVDEFFEAALDYMSGGRIDPRAVPSASVRAQIIGAMLGAGRYLFVLDGLEVLQYQEGDRYGLLQSAELRALLEYFAAPGHESFCLVTSRAPLLDLLEYTSYRHHDVERLLPADGRELLGRLGVRGRGADLDRLVAAWDGHALTLSLLGGYIVEHYGGDLPLSIVEGRSAVKGGGGIEGLPAPSAGEPRYERVHRVLRRYDEHLSGAEREFLKLFAAFRTPVHESAFEKVFRPLLPSLPSPQPSPKGRGSKRPSPAGGGAGGEGDDLPTLVRRLVGYRILRHDSAGETYTAHPLVRSHYLALLTQGDTGQQRAAHEQIKDYYLSLAGETKRFPTLDDLKPLIEVVHHACRAGAYDEAYYVMQDRIYRGWSKRVLVNRLGAWETALALMREFFPGGDATIEPQVTRPADKRWILNETGLCLMSLGRLRQAAPFFERYVTGNIEAQDWLNASHGYQNLVELRLFLGELRAGAEAAGQALELARRAQKKGEECDSLAWKAWAAHLRGDTSAAAASFQQAEALGRKIEPKVRYLYSLYGIQHAGHLRRAGPSTGSGQGAAYARRVSEANIEICERKHWPDDWSRSLCVLGDLEAQAGNHSVAGQHYAAALKLARGISDRAVLIEALLARGRWAGQYAPELAGLENQPTPEQALNDLNEALGYALEGEYRLYEADIRVGLAWALLALGSLSAIEGSLGEGEAGQIERARAEARRALEMSRDMGYHWGVVDAEEVLSRL